MRKGEDPQNWGIGGGDEEKGTDDVEMEGGDTLLKANKAEVKNTLLKVKKAEVEFLEERSTPSTPREREVWKEWRAEAQAHEKRKRQGFHEEDQALRRQLRWKARSQ